MVLVLRLRMLASILFFVAAAPASAAEEAKGFVRVSLPQWQTAMEFVLSDAKKKRFPLTRQAEHGPYSYGAWLPAGEYELPGALAQDGARYEPIVVRPGELTDLGALLKIQLGGYEYVWLPLQHAEAAAETSAAQAQLGQQIESTNSWHPTALPQPVKTAAPGTGLGLIVDLLMAYDRKVNKPPLSKQLREARTVEALTPLARLAVPPGTEEAGVDDKANNYYAADFGQIRVRSQDGAWTSIDTGTLDEVTAVDASGSRLVAGTLRGAVLTSTEYGKTWSQLRRLEADEIVVDIDRMGTRWFVLASQSAGQRNPWIFAGRLRVYSSARDDLSDLAALKDIVLPKNMFGRMGGRGDSVMGHAVGDAYLINAVEELHRLDTNTLEWTALKPPHRVDAVDVSRDGTLVTVTKIQGAFSKISLSNDRGASWIPYSRPPYAIYDAVLEAPDKGVATRWNAGAFSVSLEFYSYDPAVKDWRKSGETPAGCIKLLRDADYRQRFCLSSGGSILDQKNGTWEVEFANE